jgi:hypothetical protein
LHGSFHEAKSDCKPFNNLFCKYNTSCARVHMRTYII